MAYADVASLGIVQRVLAIEGKRTVKPIVGYLSRSELSALLDDLIVAHHAVDGTMRYCSC